MTFLWSSRARWWVIAFLWLALVVLGVQGFLQQSHELDLRRSFLDALYLTIQLPTAQYNGGPDAINWRLEVARFGMPVLTAGTLLQTASLVFAEQFRRYRVRFAKGHTVVCGLGDTGTRLAMAYAQAGERVVAIEREEGADRLVSTRDRDITVLTGDATDEKLLRVARVDRADRVVAVAGDDATNVQIALGATETVGDRPGKALRCAVHLTDASLTTLLRTADLDAQGSIRLSFFNLHERAARALVAENPPFGAGDEDHLVVAGLGQLGRSLVVTLAQQWVELGHQERLRLSLVDRLAHGRWDALCLQHPALVDIVDAHLVALDLAEPAAGSVARLVDLFAERRPTWVAVTFAEEALALSTALLVHQSLAGPGTMIVVRTRTDAWLDALLNPRTGIAAPFPGLRLFPFLDRTCTRDAVDGGVREQLAQAIHNAYLAQRAAVDRGQSSMRRPWDELGDDERDPSRRRVDGIIAALGEIGCDLAPLRRWGSPATVLTDDEFERLAELEHERWRDDRERAGWTFGEVRDEQFKRNPMLVPWSAVPPDVHDLNLRTARELPAMLARAGFEPVRRGRSVSLEL